ncbi:MAG: RluA family pseudouridine synthase [Solirubrobacteraceae bacterium]|nr:RluA family pseudouridine synthase [Solirubrobacteraceae bacterium]
MSAEGTQHTITVSEDEAGERLDKVIAEAAGTRAHAQRLIDGGNVTVDGRQHGKSRPVQAGQVIVMTLPPERDPIAIDRSTTIPIVFEDDAVLVVDKPAGVVVHPAPGVRGTTLVEQLAGKTAGGPSERPGVVHRLDRDTSGLLVMARGDHALRTLQKAIRDREVRREYLALVQGIPPARTGTIDAPIGRDTRDRTRMAIDGEAARDAVTHFEVLEYIGDATLLSVVLDTGRTHQIRVHLQAIGHPVLGDPTYGDGPYLGLERQWLHATRLTFPHPVTGEELTFEAPAPPDLDAALTAARATTHVG